MSGGLAICEQGPKEGTGFGGFLAVAEVKGLSKEIFPRLCKKPDK